MLLPRRDDAQQLPEEVKFAAEAKLIADIAQKAGITVTTVTEAGSASIKPQDLRENAKDMTVLVSCWE